MTKHLPQQSSTTETQYPSAGTHDQFLPDFSTEPKTTLTSNTAQVEEPHYKPMEKPSNKVSYTDKSTKSLKQLDFILC